MGAFRVTLELGDLEGRRWEPVEALVDTGATYTVVPASILAGLGMDPEERRPFRLADGRVDDYPLAQARIRLDGRMRFTTVVFGPEGSEPLLGVVTLEEFGLSADPLARRLVPVPGLLM